MDDINFDELDKAVTSAMKPGESQEPSVSTTPVATTPSEASSVTTSQPSAAVVPTKRRGQFMDMVHPSSDMRTFTPPANPARRQAPTLSPLSPSIVETKADTPQPAKAPQVQATVEPPVQEHSWPDPIDVAQQQSATPEVSETELAAVENSFVDSTNAPVTEPTDQASQDTVAEDTPETENPTSEPEETAPPLTPFVEGATVEKRPLGAFAPADDEISSQEPADETSGVVPVEVSEDEDGNTVTVESVVPQSEEKVKAEQIKEETPVPEIVENTAADTGIAQSIPQQYHVEQVKPDETEEHAVFDTADYHQPLPVPEKARGGHKVAFYLFVAVLMLAIGAVAGYAIFVLKLF